MFSCCNNIFSQEKKEPFHYINNEMTGGGNEDGVFVPANYVIDLPSDPLDIDGTYNELWFKYEENQFILIYYYENQNNSDTLNQTDTIYVPNQLELAELFNRFHPSGFFDDNFRPRELGYENPKQNSESLIIRHKYISVLLFSIKKENLDYFSKCAKTLEITKNKSFIRWKK